MESNTSELTRKDSEEACGGLLDLLGPAEEPKEEVQYVLDNGRLLAPTIGLAFRCSKRAQDRDCSVPGPMWGTVVCGVDQGDGWLKVGNRFLPMTLAGVAVLVPKRDYAWTDGPALTANGTVVDLDGGAPIFFSHAKELAVSYDAKCQAKKSTGLRRARRMAQAAWYAAAGLASGEACSIDPAGVVRGAAAIEPPLTKSNNSTAMRLKRFQRMRRLRSCRFEPERKEDRPVLFVDTAGKAILYLSLPPDSAVAERIKRKPAKVHRVDSSGIVMIADATGTVQGWRSVDKAPR